MRLLRLAWLDLSRHKAATWLALASLALTVGCAGILYRLNRIAEARFSGLVEAGDAIVGAKSGKVEMLLGSLHLEGGYPDFIPYRLYQTLSKESRQALVDDNAEGSFFKLIVPFVYCGTYKHYRLLGTTQAFLHQPDPGPHVALAQGQWAEENDLVIGAEVARHENLRVNDSILVTPWVSGNAGNHPARLMRVSGILRGMGNAWDLGMFTSLTQSHQILVDNVKQASTLWGNDVLHYMVVYLRPGSMTGLRTLINQLTVAQVVSVPEARTALQDLTGSGRSMGFAVMLSILLLGGLSMAALMLSRFEVKTRQLTIFRAMGFQGKELRRLLIWEGLLLGIGAVAIGTLLDDIFLPILRSHLGKGLPLPEDVPSFVWQSWPIWVAALAAALIFSVLPLILFNQTSSRDRLQGLS